MLADVMEGGEWFAAFNQFDTDRYAAPTVEGVDFPRLGIARAHNDPADGVLTVETYAASRAAAGEATRWRVSNLPDPESVIVELDGRPFGDWRALDGGTIEIESRIADQVFRLRTGWSPSSEARQAGSAPRPTRSARRSAPVSPIEILTARSAVAAGAAGCPCCA